MQKVISNFSRLIFAMVLVVLLLTVAVLEVLVVSANKKSDGQIAKAMGNNLSVVLANGENGDILGESVESQVVGDDARPLIIKRYLEKYKSPLAPYSNLIFELSQTYGYDYYWIVAIAQQESNLCKKIPDDSHNCWGYGIHKNGTLRFENYELALRSYAEYLKRQYFDKGLNTPELIMKKYCPSSNGSWAYGVQHFIDEMESGNF
jgi:hypothetical protein